MGKHNALAFLAMKRTLAAFALSSLAVPALADDAADFSADSLAAPGDGVELAPFLQCAPYARQVSGIQINGDAHTWWGQAQGRYATGNAPKVGAVMAFRRHRGMELGHVAAVSRIVDPRRVLLDHANWSPIDGRRGQIEKGAMAVDVSPSNDWSEVRVWYAPLGKVGTTVWPVEGFIYSDRSSQPRATVATAPARKQTSKGFLAAFAEFQ